MRHEKETPLLADYESDKSDSEKEKQPLGNSTLDLEEITQVCPITDEIMRDPVVASDGHTYERSAITDWQARKGTSPNTNEPITAQFKPNVALKKQIEETHKLAQAKKQLEKEKEKESRQYEKEAKKTAKERRHDRKAFELEMRKMMAEAKEERALIMDKMARQDEKIEAQEKKIDDLDAHIRANTKKAHGTFKTREEYLQANALNKATGWIIGGAATSVAGGLITMGGLELVGIYGGVAATASLVPVAGWIVVAVMGGIAIIAVGASTAVYFYYLHMDDREYARDKHLIDAALQNALNQKADGKAFDAMKTFADQHKLTLAGLPHSIFYTIAEVARGAYSKVLEWRSGLAPAPTIAYQLQYVQSLRMEKPSIEAAKEHPVHQRIQYMTENSEMPVSSKVSGPHQVPDEFIREGNQVIKDATPSNTEMMRSAMLQLAHTAVSTVATSVTERSEPNFNVVVRQATIIDKEWVRQQEVNASNQTGL